MWNARYRTRLKTDAAQRQSCSSMTYGHTSLYGWYPANVDLNNVHRMWDRWYILSIWRLWHSEPSVRVCTGRLPGTHCCLPRHSPSRAASCRGSHTQPWWCKMVSSRGQRTVSLYIMINKWPISSSKVKLNKLAHGNINNYIGTSNTSRTHKWFTNGATWSMHFQKWCLYHTPFFNYTL